MQAFCTQIVLVNLLELKSVTIISRLISISVLQISGKLRASSAEYFMNLVSKLK